MQPSTTQRDVPPFPLSIAAMARASNAAITVLNVVTLVASILAIGSSVWFYTHPGSVCQRLFLQRPLLIAGLVVLGVSLLGLIGSCCRVSALLWMYLIVMFLVILAVIGFVVLGIVVTNKGVGEAISGRGFKEYRLGDYSNWLQKYVINEENWDKIKSCLVDANVCESMAYDGGHRQSAADFYKKRLSPIESGCCKPPTHCGFDYQNATVWTIPRSGSAGRDGDCMIWTNNQKVLCFDCQSCKAGVLANIKKEWRSLAIAMTCILVFLILVYSIGCCALGNNQQHGRHKV